MGESDPEGVTLQCSLWSQGKKLGTAGPHIAALNEWRKNVWKGCGVESEGPDPFERHFGGF